MVVRCGAAKQMKVGGDGAVQGREAVTVSGGSAVQGREADEGRWWWCGAGP